MTQIEMDKPRELRWTIGAIKRFSGAARMILRRDGVANIADLTPKHILARYGVREDIMEIAIGEAAGLSLQEDDDRSTEASRAMDCYLKISGNSLETLGRAIYRSFLVCTDPSGIATLEIDEEENLKAKIEKLEALTASYRAQLKVPKKKSKSKTSGEPATT